MIKKYAMIIAVLLVILMFTSTSSASFLFSEGKIYEGLPENSLLKTMLDRLYQVAYNNDDDDDDDDVALDVDEDDETDDEDDGEYDDEMDPDDGPEEDVLLPNVLEEGFYWTPDNENKSVNDSEDTSNTIDHPDGDDGGVVWGNETVDSDGNEGTASNETTIPDYIDEGKWTVEQFVEIVTERNVKLGALLERVIECTVATDENGFFSGTNWIKGEAVGTVKNGIVGHVITTDGEGGTAENNVVDNVVLTDGSQ